MKSIRTIWIALLALVGAMPCLAAMTPSEIRSNARFMTDRMAHELDMSSMQRDDAYEINYDFFARVNDVVDDMAAGYSYAIDRYYEMLDERNEDLSYVLTRSQFGRFMDRDYFYRPLYVSDRRCTIRLYAVYDNPAFYFFSAPLHYLTYSGLHSRMHYAHGFYCNRYSHPRYTGPWIRPSRHSAYVSFRRHDFGPGISGRPMLPPARPLPSRPPYRPTHPARPGYRPEPNRPPVRPDYRPETNRPSRPNYRPEQRPETNRPSRPNYRPEQRPETNRPSRPNVRPGNSNGNRPSRDDFRPQPRRDNNNEQNRQPQSRGSFRV